MTRFFSAILAGALLSGPLHAQEVILGLGYSDFFDSQAADAGLAEIEYHFSPIHQRSAFSLAFGAVLSYDTEEDSFIGAGLVAKYDLDQNWFLEGSVMPGAYFKGNPLNALGHTLEFRTLLGLGHNITDSSAITLAIVHKSNASLSTTNPGVNSVLLRYHYRF